MQQLFAVALAVLCIPVLLKFKIPIGPTLLILGVVAGAVGGLAPGVIAQAFANVFLEESSRSSVLIVIEIGMLSVLMSHYGLLKRAEEALRKLIPSPRLIIMLMPAMVGALQAPGGAALSAPFVNRLGTEMGLTKGQRANVNVVCRHVLMMLVPFSANMIIVKSVAPGVDIFKLAMLNLGFVALMQVTGYFVLLRKSKPMERKEVTGREWLGALWEFALTLSPIYMVIVLNMAFSMPYTVALVFSGLLVFLLSDKKDFPRWLGKSFNKGLAVMIVSVYFFQNIVGDMEGLLALFGALISGHSSLVFMVMVALVGLVFGLATGLMYLPLGVLIPIVMNAPHSGEMAQLIDLFYVFCWCFLGYFFSPIHLCQLLSDKEVGCTVGERYRTYLPMMLIVPVIPVVLYLAYTLLLT